MTYPCFSADGLTFSWMQNVNARAWSAMRRIRVPSGLRRLICYAHLLGGGGDDRLEDVGGEDGRHPLQAGRGAFEAHPRVDVLLRQRLELARGRSG